MESSDSSDSDSAELMTLLTTKIFDFHQVINSLMTPTTTPTPAPSLVKTSLKQMLYRYATHSSFISKAIFKPVYIYSYYTRARCRYGKGCIYAHSPEELKEWEQECDRKKKEKLTKELEEKEEKGSLEMASKTLKRPTKDVSY